MAQVVCNTSFACSFGSFAQDLTYDSTQPWVGSATAAYPEHFSLTSQTKTCVNAFLYRDTRGGSFERFIRVADVLPAADPAVTAAPSNFA